MFKNTKGVYYMNLYNNKISRRWNDFVRKVYLMPKMRKKIIIMGLLYYAIIVLEVLFYMI